MKNLEYSMKNLVKTIHSSNEYNQYHRLLEKIKQDEELYRSMCEYRKRAFCIQMEDHEDSMEKMASLRNEFAATINNNAVAEFLIAELRLNKMARQVNSGILNSFDFDVDFL